jgi:hypothetical protein
VFGCDGDRVALVLIEHGVSRIPDARLRMEPLPKREHLPAQTGARRQHGKNLASIH